jgi:phospholipid/cholesterol/gamma-HCH transport system permease protein
MLRAWSGPVRYLGALGLLAAEGVGSLLRRRDDEPRLTAVIARQAEGMLLVGLPLIAMIHIGFGAFLSMQAFFRATFAESNGAVVGLGMLRSVAPMLTGFVLAGLLAVRISAELQGGVRPGLDADPDEVPDRDVLLGLREDTRPTPSRGRVVLARVVAAVLAGPALTLWGAAVGTFVGALISSRLLGLTTGMYFGLFFEMLQVPDVLTVLVNGSGFAAVSALIACHEALGARRPRAAGLDFRPVYRSVLVSTAAILLLNALWFSLAYRAGAPFGPRIAAVEAVGGAR